MSHVTHANRCFIFACAILFLMFVCLIRLRVSLHICQSKCWLCLYDCFDDVYIFIWLCLYSPRIFFLVFFFSTIIFFSFLRLCLYSPRIFNHICIHIYIVYTYTFINIYQNGSRTVPSSVTYISIRFMNGVIVRDSACRVTTHCDERVPVFLICLYDTLCKTCGMKVYMIWYKV